MDKLINQARELLKQGASLETIQGMLREKLTEYKSILNYTDEQMNEYNEIINNLGNSTKTNKVKITSYNVKKFVACAGFALAIGTAITACGSNVAKTTDVAVETSIDEENQNDEEKEVEYVLPDYLTFKADDMTVAITNITEFLNDGLSKGLGTIKEDDKLVSSFNEDNLSKKTEAYFDMYIMANINSFDYKTLAELNQQGNLTADEIYERAINSLRETYEDSYTLEEGQELQIDKIFADKNDVKYIKQFDELIIKFNKATTEEEKAEVVKETVRLKEELLSYIASKKTEINPFAIDYAYTKIDVLDKLSNGQVITDSENDIKLYNAIAGECITEEQKEKYGIKEEIEKFNGDGSTQAFINVIRNMEYSIIVEKMEAALDYADKVEPNVETSYNYVVAEIVKNIDLTNFKANKYTSSDWIYMTVYNTNTTIEEEIKNYKEPETVVKDNIPASQVPEKDKVKDQTTVTVDYDKKETTSVYLKAKKDAIENSTADLAFIHKQSGSAAQISKITVPKKPSLNSTDYNEVYDYWYAVTWNEELENRKYNEKFAEAINKKEDEVFVPVEEEIIIDKSPNYNSTGKTEYYEEIEKGTVVEEGIVYGDTTSNTQTNNSSSTSTSNNVTVETEQGTVIEEGIIQEQGQEVNEGIILSSYSHRVEELEAYKSELLASIDSYSYDMYNENTTKTI